MNLKRNKLSLLLFSLFIAIIISFALQSEATFVESRTSLSKINDKLKISGGGGRGRGGGGGGGGTGGGNVNHRPTSNNKNGASMTSKSLTFVHILSFAAAYSYIVCGLQL
ncbi:hypothetical protein RND81_08G017100 [Saponaria officinalis]|uniref:Glycine-rich protein n=1 Tax=Saponaria officinalis TaxID=3572 RepID=A0AAW1J2Y5_SAPOF